MKRSVLRIGCAALSLSVTAGLMTGCNLMPPASPLPDSKPVQTTEDPADTVSPTLDDGKLRILFSNSSNGGNTVLCGNTVLYQASSTETVYLVSDSLTGVARYYLRQWSDPATPDGRLSALYDRSGKEVLSFDRAYDAALTGTLLVLTAPESMAYSPYHNRAPGDCRVIDLSTGEELAVPENTYGCTVVGDYLAFDVCNAPDDFDQQDPWDSDNLFTYCAVLVQDRQVETVYQADRASTYSFFSSDGDTSAPADWLVLSHYDEDGSAAADSLYNTATGEELNHYIQYLGAGMVSLYNNGKYQLVDLVSTEQSEVLCEYDDPLRYYVPGAAITEPEAYIPESSGRYVFHDLLTGEEKTLYSAGTDTTTLAIYAMDGTVRVFDRQTGVLLTDTTIDPVEGQIRASVEPEENGWVWITQYDNDNYVDTAVHICGPDGTHKTLDLQTLEKAYNYYSPMLATENGVYFYGCYNGPGNSWLYDVLDSNGNVVVSGLRSCYSYYTSSSNGLPEGVFAAVKGFESGWMDLTGQWLYHESIFASATDEMDNYYF